MKTLKLLVIALSAIVIFVNLISCSGNSKQSNEEDYSVVYIVGHSDDVGKYGEGTYINTNTEYTDRDGIRWSKDNIFAPGPGESLSDEKFQRRSSGRSSSGRSSSGYNQYSEGYEQGQEDARRGLDPNPYGYGGNGQFEKGYEDGYEDW